jgi:hypothetical protein
MSDQPEASPRAIGSLKLGVWSLFLMAFTGLPAVAQGLRGLRDIRRDPHRLRGRALALCGIGMGLLGTSLGVALFLVALEKVREARDLVT